MAIWQASRPTVIDSKIWGWRLLNKGFRFLDFGRGWRLRGGSRYFLAVNPSFFCLPCPWVFRIFSFLLRLPFWVFTLESHFFHFLWLSHYALKNSRFIPNRWVIYQDAFGWKFLKENLFSLGIHVQSKWTFTACNVGLGSGFRKKG